jgi:hypothetical protein
MRYEREDDIKGGSSQDLMRAAVQLRGTEKRVQAGNMLGEQDRNS